MNKRNLQVTSLVFGFVVTVASAQAQPPGGPPAGGDQSLAAKMAALEARVAKLESGQVTASDLAGTYDLHGFQTELRARHNDGFTAVSSYVFQGVTMVLAADGTGTFNGGTELGHALGFFIGTPTFIPPSRSFINDPGGAPPNFTWSYANGVVSWSISSFSPTVAAGGRVLVATGANPVDGTTVILIMTRRP